MSKRKRTTVIAIFLVFFAAAFIYFLPPVRERVDYHLDDWRTRIKYALDPPEKVVFAPQSAVAAGLDNPASQATIEAIVQATLNSMPSATPPAAPSGASGTPAAPAASPTVTPTPTVSPTPLPGSTYVKGVRYEDQHGLWNYCGPANLSMALSFWKWPGDRLVTGKWLKPYDKDKNVMPDEMVAFVNTQTDGLKAIARVGGSLDLLKTLLVNNFPVLVEKGAYLRDTTGVTSWMGHYEVVTGYDDAKGVFIAQDSYLKPDLEVPYDVFESGWRSFNFTYILIYPPDKEQQIAQILGPDWDESANIRRAYDLASYETIALSGIDQLFAWFNRGTNMVALEDYLGAVGAYEEYFRLYNNLGVPDNERPWRMLWYQTGPYKAYYGAGNFYAVISLADLTLERMVNEPTLEESFYWRGRAKLAAGDSAGAAGDFRQALKWHPGWQLALDQLSAMGLEQ